VGVAVTAGGEGKGQAGDEGDVEQGQEEGLGVGRGGERGRTLVAVVVGSMCIVAQLVSMSGGLKPSIDCRSTSCGCPDLQ
jgi:hypothetical protein